MVVRVLVFTAVGDMCLLIALSFYSTSGEGPHSPWCFDVLTCSFRHILLMIMVVLTPISFDIYIVLLVFAFIFHL